MEIIERDSILNLPEWFTGIVKIKHDMIVYVKNGRIHREDGPAVEFDDGAISWWLNSKKYPSKEEWFGALTLEQKENALWGVELWK